MAERKMSRRQVLDPAVADLLAGMEQRQKESQLPRRERDKLNRERAKIQARRPQRVTFDLPAVLKQHIMGLAESEKIPASQIVSLALYRFIKDMEEHRVDLGIYKMSSRSPRYEWVLDLSNETRHLSEK
jgi:hypothetical protein